MPTNRIAISAALVLPPAVLVAAGLLSAGDSADILRASNLVEPVAPATTIPLNETVEATEGPAGTPADAVSEVATTTTVAEAALPAVADSVDAATVGVAATRLQPSPRAPETSFTAVPAGEPHPDLGEPICADTNEVEALAAVFDPDGPTIGADYQRAFPLPSGRVLWLFQDAFLSTNRGPELVHNIGLLQSGSCFQLLRNGSSNSPTPYLFPELTDRYDRWFWPLGGEVGADGDLHVFVAEMVEHSGGYLGQTEPVATWLVTIDAETLTVIDQQLAPDSSAELYGWSVVSHAEHTYLYAHCYRQFGWGLMPYADAPPKVHDWTCTSDVTVARVPRGGLDTAPEYWDGTDWTADPTTAASVFPTEGRSVNAVQVGLSDGQFIAVTKVGDWWGHTVYLDAAPTPHGPWQTYDTVTVDPQCDGCNTYFASIVPFGADADSFAIALSNNTWGGHDLDEYRPTVHRVAAP